MTWLRTFVEDFSSAIAAVDARRPVWRSYQPGIGPHPEQATLQLVAREIAQWRPEYGSPDLEVDYPTDRRKECDLVFSNPPWAIEAKLFRLMGDNGKPNDNMLTHILSPYPTHRSALTDCDKLIGSGFGAQLAILIYGYDYPGLPMDPAIEAFEQLAATRVALGPREQAAFSGLVHPIHQEGRVMAWHIEPKRSA
jgi:hypothetical protein